MRPTYNPDRAAERGIRFAGEQPAASYERRSADGHYQALMCQPTGEAFRLQRALIARADPVAASKKRVERVIGALCVAIVLALPWLTWKGII